MRVFKVVAAAVVLTCHCLVDGNFCGCDCISTCGKDAVISWNNMHETERTCISSHTNAYQICFSGFYRAKRFRQDFKFKMASMLLENSSSNERKGSNDEPKDNYPR